MEKQHGGHAYNYQILSGVYHFLRNDFDEFSIEGEEYEDSLFYKERKLVVIGEAKNVSSFKQWTDISLFWRGDKKGPLLQLYDRYLKHTDIKEVVLFSSIPLKTELKSGLGISIMDSRISEIIVQIETKFNYSKGSINVEDFKIFLDKFKFQKIDLRNLEDKIIEISDGFGLKTEKKQIRYVSGHINSKSYLIGDTITRKQLYSFLDLGKEKLRKTQKILIEEFVRERILLLQKNKTPLEMRNIPKIVLHAIPLKEVDSNCNLDIFRKNPEKLAPLRYSSGYSYKINFDGVLSYTRDINNRHYSYTQLFKDCNIEGVDISLLEPISANELLIPSIAYEKEIISAFTHYLEVFELLNIQPPYLLYFTLLGVMGYTLARRKGPVHWNKGEIINRDMLEFDSIEVSKITEKDNLPTLLKPWFDLLWQTCGNSRSYNYDEEGVWGKGPNIAP